VNSKELLESLKEHYPSQLHPSDQAMKDMIRTVRTLKYTYDQIDALYDRLIQNCEFFPKTYDIITHASNLGMPTRERKPEPIFQLWADKDGRPWAKKIGETFPESLTQRDDRYSKEACSEIEGRQLYLEAYATAAGDPIKSDKVAIQNAQEVLSFFDTQIDGLDIEFVDEKRDWLDL
jgi:hypothetical protein